MSERISLQLDSAEATEKLGARLAAAFDEASVGRCVIFLHGDLGAGKTTFARGFLRGYGHAGRVPSPTYTLVEPYEFSERTIWHLDLYRLSNGAELEYLGITEMGDGRSILLVEWPEHGAGFLPDKDLNLELQVNSQGRAARMTGCSAVGEQLLRTMSSVSP